MALIVLGWSVGWLYPAPLEVSELPCEPNMMLLVCVELYLLSGREHVSGN